MSKFGVPYLPSSLVCPNFFLEKVWLRNILPTYNLDICPKFRSFLLRKQLKDLENHKQTYRQRDSRLAIFDSQQVGTGQDRTGQDRTGQDRTGQNRRGHEETGKARTDQDKLEQDRMGQERMGQVRTGQEWSGLLNLFAFV